MPSVVDDVFDLMRRFFALDEETKALIDKRASPHFRGWESVGSEFTNNRVDVREQIDIWSAWPEVTDRTGPVHDRLHGPNQWMPDDVLPGQRAITERWMTRARRTRRPHPQPARERARARARLLRRPLR